jgi:hypothetical protein
LGHISGHIGPIGGKMKKNKNTLSKFEYKIFKKTEGIPWPGEEWDEADTYKEIKKMLKEDYNNDKKNFRIVKATYEAV